MTAVLQPHPYALSGSLGPGQRLLGIDPGTRIIGLAVSDPSLTIASPVGSIRRDRLSVVAAAITGIARERNVGGIVIGLPINMDGSEGRRAESTRDWSGALSDATGLAIAFWDERLSTMAVTRAMLAADLSRSKRARRTDQAAAAYILQGALDAIRAGGPIAGGR